MDIIQKGLNDFFSQFMSVEDLICLLERIQPNSTKQSIIHWLIAKKDLLKDIPYLFFIDECELIEYSKDNIYMLPSPIDVLKTMQNSSICIHSDIVGFTKYRLLNELKTHGLPIPNDDIIKSKPYIPSILIKSSSPEVAYALSLIEDLQKPIQQIKKEYPLEQTTNQDNPPKLQATIDAYNLIIKLGHYAGERGTARKVKIFLEDHYPMYKGNALLEKSITTIINSTSSEIITSTEKIQDNDDIVQNIKIVGFKEHIKIIKKKKTQ